MLEFSDPSTARPVPVVFSNTCGWHHVGSGSHGVLLCGPVGFEALCTRQSWNVLGDMLAARGMHVLRFDYPGEGDALDRTPGALLADEAIASIRAGAQWLADVACVTTLSVIGFRLGAAFALKALADRKVHQLALLAPVLSGRTYLRELQLTSQIIAEMRPGQDAEPGEINVCGFVTSAPDCAAIKTLTKLEPIGASRTLLAMEPDRPAPEEFADAEVITFSGYGRLVSPPTESLIPFDDFNAITDWMTRDLPEKALASGPFVATTSAKPAILVGDTFRETHLRFGRSGQLVGVLCEPATAQSNVCVHIMNAGANYHIGWARMAVEHARALAKDGIASLRYDFSGIGDSVWYAEGARPHIYASRHIEDSIEAIEAMAARGYRDHIPVGLCAGAYVAFHVAARDARVTGAVAANAIRLVWHAGDRVDDLATEMLQPTTVYKEKMFSSSEWKRVLSGEVSVARIAKVVGSLIQKVGKKSLMLARIEPPLTDDNRVVRDVLVEATKRGACVTFLHAERDQSRDEAERHFGAGLKFALKQPGVSIERIAGADHELTPRAARDHFLAAMRQLVK